MKLLEIYSAIRQYEGLSGNEKSILYTLAAYGKPDGTKIYPGLARICREAGVAERTARSLLKRLETKRHLIGAVGHRGRSIEYELKLDNLVAGGCSNVVNRDENIPNPMPSSEPEPPSMALQVVEPPAVVATDNQEEITIDARPSLPGRQPLTSRAGRIQQLTKEDLLIQYEYNPQMYEFLREDQGVTREQARREWEARYGRH